MAILAQGGSSYLQHFNTVVCADPRLLEEGRNAVQDDRSTACLCERVMVALYLPGLMLCEQTMVRRWSCSGLKFCQKACESVWCLGQSPQILCRNNKQSQSWDCHPGVKDQQILPCWCPGPGRDLPWGCLKDEGAWGPGGLSSAAHFAVQAGGTGGTGVTLL